MRERAERLVERFFPGLGILPLALTLVGSTCMVLYHHHGGRDSVPTWFRRVGVALSGIDVPQFHEQGWSHLSAFVLLMLVPLLHARCHGLGPWELGLTVRGAGREFVLVGLLWLGFLPICWFFAGTEAFQATYPRLPAAATSATVFVAHELYYLIKWIAWEFYFRGYLLFSLERTLGARAAVASTLPFVVVHFGKPEAEVFGSIIAGLLLCRIALRSRSIWPGVLLHWTAAGAMDFFASSWWR
jgi:membrane protease YdiL (CAAX protease family)